MKWIDQFFLSLAAHWKKASIFGAIAFFGMIFVSLQISQAQKEESQEIETVYRAWEQDVENEALFKKLQSMLEKDRRPNPYRCKAAQKLLYLGKVQEAQKISKEPLLRLKRIAPQYEEFTQISFLIGAGEFQKALERAVSLKEKIRDRASSLYVQTLIRIAFLQQEVQNFAGERVAWNEFEELLSNPSKKSILRGFCKEGIDFESYLLERQKAI